MKPINWIIVLASVSVHPAFAQQVEPPKSAASIPGTPGGTVMTKEYVELVGRMAYVWGWPLVNNLNRASAVANLPEPGLMGGVLPVSPPGQVSMLTDYIQEKQRFVTCPNQDTVYGAGYQRLDSKPVIIQVPDFGDRFWTYQVCDARTDAFCNMGKQNGTKPGFYLLVGPNWKREKPAGVTDVFRSSTNLAVIFSRVFQSDAPEDKAAIQPLLNQIVVYPLSQFDGKMKTKDWKKSPTFQAPSSGSGETKWVIPDKFFDQLPQVMKEVPPLPGEESLYAMFQSVLDAAAKDPKIKETLTATAVAAEKDLISSLFQFHNNGRPVGNGWTSPPNGAAWGVDYLSRAASAKSNMYDNAPTTTRYIYTDFDSSSQQLNGAKKYTVTFKKDETPPVSGFWSLTLYNAEHLFSPNPLNRYSLGTKNAKTLKSNADGSLTLYVQSDSPGTNKESNWLPAPKDGDFSLYIRAYWPKKEVLDGSWKPPKVENVRKGS
jgi:hypothetical protein